MRKVAIFGGNGFIGRNFIELVIGEYIFVIFGRGNDHIEKIADSYFPYRNTSFEIDDLNRKLKGFDIVLNFSSVKVRSDLELSDYLRNAIIAENIMKSCLELGIKKYVHLSSRMVYDQSQPVPWSESTNELPDTYYGLSKLLSDKLLLTHNQRLSSSFTSLRLAQVYGLVDGAFAEDQEKTVIAQFIKSAEKENPLEVYSEEGTTSDIRDYVYIKDVVIAIELAMNSSFGGVFNIGSGHQISIDDLAKQVNLAYENPTKIVYFTSKNLGVNSYLDISKARKILKYSPAWTIGEALADMRSEKHEFTRS